MIRIAQVCIFGALLAASQATGQSCYYCVSCGDDPFSTSGATTVECSSNLCSKTKTSSTVLGTKTTSVKRGCAAAGTSTGCTSSGAGLGSLYSGSGTTCTCSGVNCNTASVRSVSIAAPALLMAIVAAVIMWR